TARLKVVLMVAAVAALDQQRLPVHVMTRRASEHAGLGGIGMWVVRVVQLAPYDIVRGPLGDLLVAGVLIVHMAIEAKAALNREHRHTLTGHDLLMRLPDRLLLVAILAL